MRGPALLVVFVVGCIARPGSTDDPWGPEPGAGSGPIGQGPGCSDSACGSGMVCARNHTCLPADQIRTVHAVWTVRGMTPTIQSCAGVPPLLIAFGPSAGSGLRLSYAPVPCVEGMFTIDKLPVSYDRVELGPENGNQLQHATVDATGTATLDLPF